MAEPFDQKAETEHISAEDQRIAALAASDPLASTTEAAGLLLETITGLQSALQIVAMGSAEEVIRVALEGFRLGYDLRRLGPLLDRIGVGDRLSAANSQPVDAFGVTAISFHVALYNAAAAQHLAARECCNDGRSFFVARDDSGRMRIADIEPEKLVAHAAELAKFWPRYAIIDWDSARLQLFKEYERAGGRTSWGTDSRNSASRPHTLSEWEAIAILRQQPESAGWTMVKWATTIGIGRQALYDSPNYRDFRSALEALREPRTSLPRGSKVEGAMDAWDP